MKVQALTGPLLHHSILLEMLYMNSSGVAGGEHVLRGVGLKVFAAAHFSAFSASAMNQI